MSQDASKIRQPPGPPSAWSYAALFVAALLAACGDGSGGGALVDAPAGGSGGAAGAPAGAGITTVTSIDGAQVVVTEGAFVTPVTIRIARDSTGAPPLPAPFGSANPTYSATPAGLQLGQTLRVRIPVDPAISADTPVALAQSVDGPGLAFGFLAGADFVPGGRAFVVGAGGLVARRN